MVHHELISPWTKWLPFRKQYSQTHFLEWGCENFDLIFTEICSEGSNWQLITIGSGNGLWPFSAPSHYLNQCWPSSPIHICSTRGKWVNSQRPSDSIWHPGSRKTLVQITACCRMVPNHSLSYCRLIINNTLRNIFQWNKRWFPFTIQHSTLVINVLALYT